MCGVEALECLLKDSGMEAIPSSRPTEPGPSGLLSHGSGGRPVLGAALGSWTAALAEDKVPAILQRAECVLTRDQNAQYSALATPNVYNLNMTVHAADAGSFHSSQGQITGDMASQLQRLSQRYN
jgi:hypothetical protein